VNSAASMQSVTLRNFCDSNKLQWLVEESGGTNYTYFNTVLGHYTLIDHLMCSSELLNSPNCVKVHDDGDNLSDHLAISYNFVLHNDRTHNDGIYKSEGRERVERVTG